MKRFLSPFVLIFTLILSLIVFYVGSRIAGNTGQWALLVLLAGLLWSLPVVHWSSEADEFSRTEILLQQSSYLSMGLMSWLFVIALLRDAALLGTHVLASADSSAWFASFSRGTPAFGLAIAFTAIGSWKAYRGPRVREVRVPIQDLPAELRGFRIAQISDLHVGPTIGRAYVERLVSRLNDLQPNLTVLTGDIVDGNVQDLRDAVEPLRDLTPQDRIFYVPGNHEYYWTIQQWLPKLASLGTKNLLNRGETIRIGERSIWIGGITDPAAPRSQSSEGPNVRQAAAGGESADFRILLSHRPDFAPEAQKAGFHLQLSGHTHGGQFFPWTHVAKLFHRYFLGLMRHETMWVYVSAGTGTWGPPIRLGTTPELTLLTLELQA